MEIDVAWNQGPFYIVSNYLQEICRSWNLRYFFLTLKSASIYRPPNLSAPVEVEVLIAAKFHQMSC